MIIFYQIGLDVANQIRSTFKNRSDIITKINLGGIVTH